MERIITWENLRRFAYSNDALVTGKPRGVILEFMGLGGAKIYDEDPEYAAALAQKRILFLIPYLNPWNWMNAQAVAYTDELLDVLRARYGADLPVVSPGGSMGGLCALVYTRYAARTPVACAANCPVCDLPYHYTERPDLPRTLLSAFAADGAATLEEAMRKRSPLHLAGEMPDIPYMVCHCEEDRAVNLRMHSERFVAAMRPAHRITFRTVPGRGHCDLDEAALAAYRQFAEDTLPEG